MSGRRPRQSLARVFAVPLALAVASIAGLLLGLTGAGWRDLACWLLLASPVVAAGLAWSRAEPRRTASPVTIMRTNA